MIAWIFNQLTDNGNFAHLSADNKKRVKILIIGYLIAFIIHLPICVFMLYLFIQSNKIVPVFMLIIALSIGIASIIKRIKTTLNGLENSNNIMMFD